MGSLEFTSGSFPKIIVKRGAHSDIRSLPLPEGKRVAFLHGKSSLDRSGNKEAIEEELLHLSLNVTNFIVDGEPDPALVDEITENCRHKNVDWILAIGGGSVLDAAKAVAAMIPQKGVIQEYLEGVGTKIHSGHTIPVVALPTTSGTGSEATMNAVITNRSLESAYKKSLRHENFVPVLAVLDAELMLSTPKEVTMACALDACTQLLESYLSTKANPITDALAFQGLELVMKAIPRLAEGQLDNLLVREEMALASFYSGFCLAQAGLGLVHGIAGPLGAMVEIPHGAACGTLMGACNRASFRKMAADPETYVVALNKLNKVGSLLLTDAMGFEAAEVLIGQIETWVEDCQMPLLSEFGVTEEMLQSLSVEGANRNNPVQLSGDEIFEALSTRL